MFLSLHVICDPGTGETLQEGAYKFYLNSQTNPAIHADSYASHGKRSDFHFRQDDNHASLSPLFCTRQQKKISWYRSILNICTLLLFTIIVPLCLHELYAPDQNGRLQ